MHGLLPPASPKFTHDDIPWALSLAYERYGAYEPGKTLLFVLQALRSPDALILKNEARTAFLVANAVASPWWPDQLECHVMMLCTKPGAHWQGIKLLRESIDWARLHSCVRWRFHSETAHDVGALCRRVGAREDSPRYVIDL